MDLIRTQTKTAVIDATSIARLRDELATQHKRTLDAEAICVPHKQRFRFAEMRSWSEICSYLASVRESSDQTILLEQLKQRVVGAATCDSAALKSGIRAQVARSGQAVALGPHSSLARCLLHTVDIKRRVQVVGTVHFTHIVPSIALSPTGWLATAQETGDKFQVGNAIARWEWALLSTLPPQIYDTPRILGSPGQWTSIGGSNGPASNSTVCLLAVHENQ